MVAQTENKKPNTKKREIMRARNLRRRRNQLRRDRADDFVDSDISVRTHIESGDEANTDHEDYLNGLLDEKEASGRKSCTECQLGYLIYGGLDAIGDYSPVAIGLAVGVLAFLFLRH